MTRLRMQDCSHETDCSEGCSFLLEGLMLHQALQLGSAQSALTVLTGSALTLEASSHQPSIILQENLGWTSLECIKFPCPRITVRGPHTHTETWGIWVNAQCDTDHCERLPRDGKEEETCAVLSAFLPLGSCSFHFTLAWALDPVKEGGVRTAFGRSPFPRLLWVPAARHVSLRKGGCPSEGQQQTVPHRTILSHPVGFLGSVWHLTHLSLWSCSGAVTPSAPACPCVSPCRDTPQFLFLQTSANPSAFTSDNYEEPFPWGTSSTFLLLISV